MSKSSHLAGTNAAYVEALYETYLTEPNAVPLEWQSYFDALPSVAGAEELDIPHSGIVQHFERIVQVRKALGIRSVAAIGEEAIRLQQACRPYELVRVPPERGASRRAARTQDTFIEPVELCAFLGRLQSFLCRRRCADRTAST